MALLNNSFSVQNALKDKTNEELIMYALSKLLILIEFPSIYTNALKETLAERSALKETYNLDV